MNELIIGGTVWSITIAFPIDALLTVLQHRFAGSADATLRRYARSDHRRHWTRSKSSVVDPVRLGVTRYVPPPRIPARSAVPEPRRISTRPSKGTAPASTDGKYSTMLPVPQPSTEPLKIE